MAGFEAMRRLGEHRLWAGPPPLAESESACWSSAHRILVRQSSCNSAPHDVRNLCMATLPKTKRVQERNVFCSRRRQVRIHFTFTQPKKLVVRLTIAQAASVNMGCPIKC